MRITGRKICGLGCVLAFAIALMHAIIESYVVAMIATLVSIGFVFGATDGGE